MTDTPDYVLSTYIRCTPEALWNALTAPEAQMRYDFLGQTVTRDGALTVFSTPDGMETLHARELEADPPTRLVTTFEPKWDDTPPSRVVYVIEAQGDYCRLTVEHHGLLHDPSGGTADGWERTLAGLKTFLETGTTAQFGGDHLWAENT